VIPLRIYNATIPVFVFDLYRSLQVAFAGDAPGMVHGVMQINFVLPPKDKSSLLSPRCSYLEIRKESTVSPVSETCFRRKVFPSTSITLNEWTCEMNLSVKDCQLAGSVCCSGL
jgi:hypothetical protein